MFCDKFDKGVRIFFALFCTAIGAAITLAAIRIAAVLCSNDLLVYLASS